MGIWKNIKDKFTKYNNVGNSWEALKSHIASTRNNKYTDGVIEVDDFIADKKLSYREGCVVKYICRYASKCGEKTGNPVDLLKAAHYLLMEADSHYKDESAKSDNVIRRKDLIEKFNIPDLKDKLEFTPMIVESEKYSDQCNVQPEESDTIFNCDPVFTNDDHLYELNPKAVIDPDDPAEIEYQKARQAAIDKSNGKQEVAEMTKDATS